MYHQRLQKRVPSAEPIGVASLEGYTLCFHKKSHDGSSKCNLVEFASKTTYGVLFQMKKNELPYLDRAEGLGFGYIRKELVVSCKESPIQAFLYLAQPEYIESKLLPYDWYVDFVLSGARQNQLPQSYISILEDTLFVADPDKERTLKNRQILQS